MPLGANRCGALNFVPAEPPPADRLAPHAVIKMAASELAKIETDLHALHVS